MKKILITTVMLLMFAPATLLALPPTPAPAQEGPVTLHGATVHVGNGEVIESAVVTFEDGKITQVTTASAANRVDLRGHQVFDLSGQHIYPGLILPNSTLGLDEVSSLADTIDHTERGELNPNLRTLIAYNTDSELIPATRFNGVLTAQVSPRGGLISGTSSIVQLDAWNWEDAAYQTDDGIHINWPGQHRGQFDFSTFSVRRVANPRYAQQVGDLGKLFADAKAYGQDSEPPHVNLKLAALQGLFSGQQRLYIHSNEPADLLVAIQFAIKHSVQHVVLVTADAALEMVDVLLREEIPVIITGVHNRPPRDHDDIDLPYRLPAMLSAAGVKVGLTYPSLMNARNLPFIAGTAVAYGLSAEAALRMITLTNAEILGVDERLGSIEVGKDATLFVSRGDALDMQGNDLTHAFIGGRQITLNGMQQRLYQRFHRKYTSP